MEAHVPAPIEPIPARKRERGELEYVGGLSKGLSVIEAFDASHPEMTLSEFKVIFFWEYLHRLLARGVGVVFLVPFIFFWARGYFSRRLLWRVVILFALVVGYDGYRRAVVTPTALGLTLVGLGLLTVGGRLGGSMVFVHGMRVADDAARSELEPE